ncbi:tumor necrosis factor ligand superfamily member 15-like [Labrus mixtus]|uniref:tumor necrosis factor ligand superfamily member 15-like n=1 Tax=Labrus mixtus TaxID=508554 RepID=UPI0029C0C2E2|nr:tumor necrosis factor ligand superfamily member 15-like [Labrus mixtus]
MEAKDGRRLLIRTTVKQTSGMEEDYVQNALLQLLRQEQLRSIRMSRCVVLTLLLVLAGLALLTAAQLRGRGHPAGTEDTMQPYSHSAGKSCLIEQPRSFNSPSAMLTAPRGCQSDLGLLEWESEDGNAYCHGGFSYSSGSLVVPIQGIYRVFLQITFESGRETCRDWLKLTNIVFVSRDSYVKNVSLLSSVDTVICSKEPWSKSLYTAGLFSLEANSRLIVKSSNPGFIAKREEQVFFGAEFVP